MNTMKTLPPIHPAKDGAKINYIREIGIPRDPGADSGDEGKSKRAPLSAPGSPRMGNRFCDVTVVGQRYLASLSLSCPSHCSSLLPLDVFTKR